MIKPEDYITQAEMLIGRSKKRPHEIHLRRAVSAAYYGMFHTLCKKSGR